MNNTSKTPLLAAVVLCAASITLAGCDKPPTAPTTPTPKVGTITPTQPTNPAKPSLPEADPKELPGGKK